MTKEDLKLQLLAGPSFLLVGVGIMILSSSDPSEIHPALDNQAIAYTAFLIGGIGVAISVVKGIRIFMRR
ncbi:hypothetical protein [Vreelandella sp. EE27]